MKFSKKVLQTTVGLHQLTQLTFTCSKSPIEALEKGVKYVQSYKKNTRTTSLTSFWCFLVFLLFSSNIFHTFFKSYYWGDFEQLNVIWGNVFTYLLSTKVDNIITNNTESLTENIVHELFLYIL